MLATCQAKYRVKIFSSGEGIVKEFSTESKVATLHQNVVVKTLWS